MLNFNLNPLGKILDSMNQNTRNLNVIAMPVARRNSSWQHLPAADKSVGGFAAAVASGSGLTLVTVAAANTLNLHTITVAGSAAGRYQLTYNAVIFAEIKLLANTPFEIVYPWPGLFFTALAANLALVNQTGGASDLSGSVTWAEVVP